MLYFYEKIYENHIEGVVYMSKSTLAHMRRIIDVKKTQAGVVSMKDEKKSTKQYEMFFLRDDNRKKIDSSHVEKIRKSIECKNLLHIRPIVVNSKMEVMDGQHRLKAAQLLGTEVYYEVCEELDINDIVYLNTSKSWILADFLNFHVKNGKEEYIKLNSFIQSEKITFKMAISIFVGESFNKKEVFRSGGFQFEEGSTRIYIQMCQSVTQHLYEVKGKFSWIGSGKFWKALFALFQHEEFDYKTWDKNLRNLAFRMSARVSLQDYIKMVQEIYNYKLSKKIDLMKLPTTD